VTSAILGSAVKHGWEHVADANASDAERIAFTPSTIRDGRRTTSYDAFVRPAVADGRRAGHRNLTVATRTRVGRLLFDGCRATGVRVRDNSGNRTDITARKEVIVCAGAVETTLLLERSGIGRPDVLSAAGIEPRIESPNVGMRVIEQRGIALQVTLDAGRVAPNRLSTRHGQAAEILRYLRSGQGLLATAGYDLVCQFKSTPQQARPDVQGLFVPMALDTASSHMKPARHPGILFMAYPLRPQTRSTVHLSGQDPDDPPVIDPHFLETEADRGAVAPVLEMAREILATSPVADLITGEEFPGPAVTTPEQAVRYSLATGTGIYHAVGAAAMGVNDEDATDPQLRVRGTEGLRIADASVLPFQLSGNTAAPAMLVGYRAADLILGEL
jgi:choline dehydrogenase